MTLAIAQLDQLGRRARISTKAWYAAFLLLKNCIDPVGSQMPICFSTKARYAAFLLSKNLIVGPVSFRDDRLIWSMCLYLHG